MPNNEPIKSDKIKVGTLVRDIFKSRPTEIYCDEAANQMVRCIDQALSPALAKERFPDLFHHLQFCPDCTTEYALLLALQEPDNAADYPPEIPAMPAQFRPHTGTLLQRLLHIAFPGFLPLTPTVALRGKVGFAPVVIALGEATSALELRIQSSPNDPDLRTLICTLRPTATTISSSQSPPPTVTLALETATGDLLDEQQLDPSGEAFFEELMPDKYRLRLQFDEQTYLIEDIALP